MKWCAFCSPRQFDLHLVFNLKNISFFFFVFLVLTCKNEGNKWNFKKNECPNPITSAILAFLQKENQKEKFWLVSFRFVFHPIFFLKFSPIISPILLTIILKFFSHFFEEIENFSPFILSFCHHSTKLDIQKNEKKIENETNWFFLFPFLCYLFYVIYSINN